MTRRKLLQILGLTTAATFLSGCRSEYNWNQKLEMVVTTPEGEKSGAAVSHVRTLYGQLPMTSTAWEVSLQGEATVVDLGHGKYLFALLSEESKSLAGEVFKSVVDPLHGAEETMTALQNLRAKAYVSSTPMLVTFDDVSDPKSVKQVKASDLAATFGPGYALKSITLEITDEKVTAGVVEKVLGWLPSIWPNQLDGHRYESLEAKDRFANSLNPGNFGDYSKGKP